MSDMTPKERTEMRAQADHATKIADDARYDIQSLARAYMGDLAAAVRAILDALDAAEGERAEEQAHRLQTMEALAAAEAEVARVTKDRDEWKATVTACEADLLNLDAERSRANATEDRARVLWAALADLVYLKDEIHDTPEYHERKEPAWQAARDALTRVTQPGAG